MILYGWIVLPAPLPVATGAGLFTYLRMARRISLTQLYPARRAAASSVRPLRISLAAWDALSTAVRCSRRVCLANDSGWGIGLKISFHLAFVLSTNSVPRSIARAVIQLALERLVIPAPGDDQGVGAGHGVSPKITSIEGNGAEFFDPPNFSRPRRNSTLPFLQ